MTKRDPLIPVQHGRLLGCSAPSRGSFAGDSAFIQGSTRCLFLRAVLCQQHMLRKLGTDQTPAVFPCPGQVALDCSESGNSWPFVSVASISDGSVQKSVVYLCF